LTRVVSKPSPIALAARSDSGLPDFQQPPVDEVAISLQFPAVSNFNVAHFGLFWQHLRADYPNFELQQPISNVTEQFGPGAALGRQLGLTFLQLPEIRCWFLDESGNRIVQVQRDRLVHNWRKLKGTESYPRYPELRERLEREWLRFCDFLRDQKLERPKINQAEVLYVNHIEYDKGWSGYGELDKVIAALATPKAKNKFLPSPERMSMEVTYCLEENAGRLYVAFGPVIRTRDGKEVLQMSLTARGAPKSSSDEDVFAWLDMARKWVVRGFADFTTPEMHQVWGKQ
jgi:uncharacterized protein (TIGR04255 family)